MIAISPRKPRKPTLSGGAIEATPPARLVFGCFPGSSPQDYINSPPLSLYWNFYRLSDRGNRANPRGPIRASEPFPAGIYTAGNNVAAGRAAPRSGERRIGLMARGLMARSAQSEGSAGVVVRSTPCHQRTTSAPLAPWLLRSGLPLPSSPSPSGPRPHRRIVTLPARSGVPLARSAQRAGRAGRPDAIGNAGARQIAICDSAPIAALAHGASLAWPSGPRGAQRREPEVA
jgi:hypothetical protein